MKRPSFQFYPGDWQSDLKLRRCSPAARGVWIDILCAFHDSDDGYGLLRWPLKEIASTVGASMAHVRELVDKGVLRGSDAAITDQLVYVPRSGRKDGDPVTLITTQPGPLWYSKRLVKDEHVRTIRGEGTRFGDESGASPKTAGKPAPKPPFGDGTTSSPPSPSPPSEVGGLDPSVVTPYGAIAKALRQAGIEASPGTLRFRTLVDAGATAEEFLAMVPDALKADKPFAYLLGAVEGERKRAAKTSGELHRGPLPATETAFARTRRERVEEMTGGLLSTKPRKEVLDATDPLALG